MRRIENITSTPRDAKYLNRSLIFLGAFAVAASIYVAWPALTHLGMKLL